MAQVASRFDPHGKRMKLFTFMVCGAAVLLSQGGCGRSRAPEAKLSFNESLEPILSENCYACHGPDPGARKAGLRLDRGEFAFAPHQDSHEKYGPAIIPGNPDKSPLVHRIETKNRSEER